MSKPARWSMVLFAAVSAHAAVIRGDVVEKLTGYTLSRATVTLQPVLPTAGPAQTVVTRQSGLFTFPKVSAGAYLLKAKRRGFLPLQYGQKRWDSAGTMITVDSDATVSLRLQMLRFGGITGTVRDENEVGIPDQAVAAYSATQPPRFVAAAMTDDRGIYRIGGLEPGSYFIRTTGSTDDDRAYIPTFSRQTQRVEEARAIVVYPDEDSRDGDVRPFQGRLFELSGYTPLPNSQYGFEVTVTLASDMGRVISYGPRFRFVALSPVRYEIYAEARENAPGTRVLGGYMDLQIGRNLSPLAVPLNDVRESQFSVEGAAADTLVRGELRRRDLAGAGPILPVTVVGSARVPVPPGRWEFKATAPDRYYVSRFVPASREPGASPEGWNELLVTGLNFGRFAVITLSNAPGAVHGVVRSAGAAAQGVPVFLEAWDPVTRRRLLELRETRTDAQGNYRFPSLAPGSYRVLSTFDYASPDPAAFDASRPQEVRVESAGDVARDLELSGLP